MQYSLVRNGELHNNLRMGWGKALLEWSESPQEALERLVYLNDKYALDGQAPPSYGGLMWCLGLFDSPKGGDRPITGSLRTRPLSSQNKYSIQELRRVVESLR